MASFLNKLKSWFRKPVKKSLIKLKVEPKNPEPVNINHKKYRKLTKSYKKQWKLVNQLERKIERRERERRRDE